MRRQCSRTGCAEEAISTLSYQYARSLVWLDDLSDGTRPAQLRPVPAAHGAPVGAQRLAPGRPSRPPPAGLRGRATPRRLIRAPAAAAPVGSPAVSSPPVPHASRRDASAPRCPSAQRPSCGSAHGWWARWCASAVAAASRSRHRRRGRAQLAVRRGGRGVGAAGGGVSGASGAGSASAIVRRSTSVCRSRCGDLWGVPVGVAHPAGVAAPRVLAARGALARHVRPGEDRGARPRPVRQRQRRRADAPALLVVVVGAPLVEELVYRGHVAGCVHPSVPRVARRGASWRCGSRWCTSSRSRRPACSSSASCWARVRC